MGPIFGSWRTGFESNGEQIYFTATNEQGKYIQYSGGAGFGGMMGGRLACASCHGEDGRGSQHVMHMDVMDAPDIRFETLSTKESGHLGDEQEDAHGEEYDIETFHQAVVLGQHPDGDTLSRDMPRWDMSEDDLIALFEYLKTLP